jgi:hypothetical protein
MVNEFHNRREEAAMLTMTDAAAGYLSDVLEKANVSSDTAAHLVVEADGLAPALDSARPGDTTFNHEGRKVLLLDALASEVLADRTLDVHSTEDGPSLSVT